MNVPTLGSDARPAGRLGRLFTKHCEKPFLLWLRHLNDLLLNCIWVKSRNVSPKILARENLFADFALLLWLLLAVHMIGEQAQGGISLEAPILLACSIASKWTVLEMRSGMCGCSVPPGAPVITRSILIICKAQVSLGRLVEIFKSRRCTRGEDATDDERIVVIKSRLHLVIFTPSLREDVKCEQLPTGLTGKGSQDPVPDLFVVGPLEICQ